jgi:hypothetical protein
LTTYTELQQIRLASTSLFQYAFSMRFYQFLTYRQSYDTTINLSSLFSDNSLLLIISIVRIKMFKLFSELFLSLRSQIKNSKKLNLRDCVFITFAFFSILACWMILALFDLVMLLLNVHFGCSLLLLDSIAPYGWGANFWIILTCVLSCILMCIFSFLNWLLNLRKIRKNDSGEDKK